MGAGHFSKPKHTVAHGRRSLIKTKTYCCTWTPGTSQNENMPLHTGAGHFSKQIVAVAHGRCLLFKMKILPEHMGAGDYS
jgi:hypothetical protein